MFSWRGSDVDIKCLDETFNSCCIAVKDYLWWFFKSHAWIKIISPFPRGGGYCNRSPILFNYLYTTYFAIHIIYFLIYFNVPRLNIVVPKTFILHYEIFSQKVCPLHNNVSTKNITIVTWGSKRFIECCNCL